MLSVTRVSVKQASEYYSKDDYYLESAGVWQGKGAETLGLDGNKIHEKDFNRLIKGINPENSAIEFKIANGGKESLHTAGADLTFSAPKSVSCMALMFDDERIKEAHNQAVSKTLEYIEENLAQVRRKVDGQVLHEKTDNLIAAKFMHMSSRELDPQLHTHCVVINASQKEDGGWRAVDYSEIFNNKKNLGMMYRNELAIQLQKMGYKVEFDSQGLFEIAGFNQKIMDEFSVRSKQIDERYQELKKLYPDVSKAELKAQATIETRKAKDEPKLDELKEQWQARFAALGITQEQVIDKEYQLRETRTITINEAVKQSVAALTETEAVVSKEQIIATTNRLHFAKFSTEEIIEHLNHSANYIKLPDNKYTTKELAKMERDILDTVKNSLGSQQEIISNNLDKRIADYELNHGFKLTTDQANGVGHILQNNDKFIAIQGSAGTGKTTMLDCIREVCQTERPDLEIIGLSFTGKAASEIEAASQIKSSTIASFINSKEAINPDSKRLYVVDEASMVSIKDMNALIAKCQSENAKVVLIGDTKQLQSIGAGKIFASLQEHHAINTVELKENVRQVEEKYKLSVDLMADHKALESYLELKNNQKIIEAPEFSARLQLMTDKYCKSHEDTILVTSRNADRDELNQLIRSKLQDENKISKDNINFTVHESKSMQTVDKFFIDNYKIDDIVVCHSRLLGKPNTEFKITEINPITSEITGVDKDGIQHKINVSEHGNQLNVYQQNSKDFALGEKIIFLRNDKQLGIMNGQAAIVTNIQDKIMNVKLDNGKELSIDVDRRYNYITHGYALTTYKSQGQTAKNVIYHADTKASMNYNQAYVGMSRGKHDISIFTDDKTKLSKSMGIDQDKTTTLSHRIKFESIKPTMKQSQSDKLSMRI